MQASSGGAVQFDCKSEADRKGGSDWPSVAIDRDVNENVTAMAGAGRYKIKPV